MLMMFKRGIRGGITYISKRYSEANNKYMKNHDKEKDSKLFHSWTPIIFTGGQCLKDFQQLMVSNG